MLSQPMSSDCSPIPISRSIKHVYISLFNYDLYCYKSKDCSLANNILWRTRLHTGIIERRFVTLDDLVTCAHSLSSSMYYKMEWHVYHRCCCDESAPSHGTQGSSIIQWELKGAIYHVHECIAQEKYLWDLITSLLFWRSCIGYQWRNT